MKLVVLEGITLNKGDLDWSPLKALGETTIYDRTTPEQIVERARDAEIVLSNKCILDRNVLEALPKLRYIGLFSTGYNVVDIPTADRLGIVVTHIPAYSTFAVTQMVFALLLELTNRTSLHNDAVHGGEWSASPDFCFWKTPLTELYGKVMGIIGMGQIGQRTAQVALAMGMRVIAYAPRRKTLNFNGVEWCELDEVFRESDVLSVHCPLNDETKQLIREENLRKMKPTAYLINTSRGGVVNEEELACALREHRIAGAGVDVLSSEPPLPDNPLLHAPNCVITPHIAWAAQETRARLLSIAVENLQAFLSGHPIHVVPGIRLQ